MSTPAIDCQKLSKRYGRHAYALRDLTLQVQPGEVYGFLGPNGAGKSTTIRTLMNFIQPTNGTAAILGLDIVTDSVAIKREVGYLSGEFIPYKRMTGRQFLQFMQQLQPVKRPERMTELIQAFEVELDKPTGDLSKGNRQKLGLVQAMMHDPRVLILDEPTSGLDPLMQAVFYEQIQQLKTQGTAVFLSSHDLAEVRKMCDRVGFIRQGQLVAEQTITELQQLSTHRFDITFKGKAPVAILKLLKGAEVEQLTEHAVSVRMTGNLSPLFAALSKSDVLTLEQHAIDLEDEFLHFYKETS